VEPGAAPPSVDALAREIADLALPQPLLVDAAREAIAARAPETARARAEAIGKSLLQPVVNATGVLLHTNLGRAPIAVAHRARPTNVELDLASGRRGRRGEVLGRLLGRLTGAEDALVVNNGAAAVLLCLTALAAGEDVVVSRGELVEIGGGFRIPEVLTASGARLVEVGTTNRTRIFDYERTLGESGPPPALLLKVHPSNYTMSGFVEAVSVQALARLGPPVLVDLGSGLLDARTPWLRGGPPRWLAGEPAVRQTLEAGAALVTFSGDKLLGGPQAGIIAGAASLVERCRRHPLFRALRPGGLVLEALQETLLCYLRRDAAGIPFWRMATAEVATLRRRAEAVVAEVSAAGVKAQVVECSSAAGGGSLPGVEIPSMGVRVAGDRSAELRAHHPPVIATVQGEGTTCDLRSVDPADDPVLVAALAGLKEASDFAREPEKTP
jgi:L-seryl-tRNA(Ser) seleniumtransferase